MSKELRTPVKTMNPRQKEWFATAMVAMVLADGQSLWKDPIVTEITPIDTFYDAEDYHQGYFRNNPWAGYCQVIIQPKVAKFRKEHLEALKV